MLEHATSSDVPPSMDVCTSKVVTKHLARLSATRSLATVKLATVGNMNDYYPSSVPSVAAERRSMLSISMDSIECESRDLCIQHSLKATITGTQPCKRMSKDPHIVQDSDQISPALHPNTSKDQNRTRTLTENRSPSAASPVSAGLSQLPTLLRSLLKKCSSTTNGSYQLADDKHYIPTRAEPVLLQLSYFDGRPGLTNDSARKSLLTKNSVLGNVKSSGLPQNRPGKTPYRARVLQSFEAIWKGFGK